MLPDLSHVPLEEQVLLRQSPAADPPPGVVADLENPPNSTNEYRGFVIFCIVLTTLFAIGRFYGTWCSSRRWFLSDAMFVTALCAYFTYLAFVLDAINKVGYLMHQWDVTLDEMLCMLYSFTIGPILYAIVTMFTKIACLVEWLRIFNPTGQRGYFWWLTFIMLGMTATYYLAAVFLHSFACRPFVKSYDPFVPGTCINVAPVYLSSAIINMVLDLGILVLPLQVIWKLQMTRQRKLGVGIVFAFGILWKKSEDILYETSIIGIVFTAEMTCGFLVFCIPSLPKAAMGTGLPKLIPGISTMISRAQKPTSGNAWFGRSDVSSSGSNNYEKLDEKPRSLQTIGGGKMQPFQKSSRGPFR